MSKQDSIIPLTGSMDRISFYKTGDGYIARKKTGVSKNKIATHPAFQRTRENMAEFARAGSGSQLVRNTFKQLLKGTADRQMTGRLTRAMRTVIKADLVSDRGKRNIVDGEAELLKGFEFNNRAPLGQTLSVNPVSTIDRVTGEHLITIPEFIPGVNLEAPTGTTHFTVVATAATIDFENDKYESQLVTSATLPLNMDTIAPITLSVQLTANSTHPIFLVLGIQFTQEVNGKSYSLNSGAFNALTLVDVNGG